MADLVVELSKKARETFAKWNGEGHIEITSIGSGWCAHKAALVEGGKPEDPEAFIELKQEGVTLWVPKDLAFEDDRVRIDVKGMFWSTMVLVETAIL